jgi:hypothetical protein
MALHSQTKVNFTEVDLTEILELINQLESKLKEKVVQLNAKENIKYGKIGPDTENLVNQIYKDCQIFPNLISPFVDLKDWENQKRMRDSFVPAIQKLETIVKEITETNRLLSHDFYQNCMSTYRNCRYLSEENVPGTKTIYDQWSVFFDKTSNKATENNTK